MGINYVLLASYHYPEASRKHIVADPASEIPAV